MKEIVFFQVLEKKNITVSSTIKRYEFLSYYWLEYLYPYVHTFFQKHNIDFPKTQNSIIKNELLNYLQLNLSDALQNLLNTYQLPPLRQQQIHSSRFERIVFNGKKYKINYVTDEKGRICYIVYCLIQLIKETIESKLHLEIGFKITS